MPPKARGLFLVWVTFNYVYKNKKIHKEFLNSKVMLQELMLIETCLNKIMYKDGSANPTLFQTSPLPHPIFLTFKN